MAYGWGDRVYAAGARVYLNLVEIGLAQVLWLWTSDWAWQKSKCLNNFRVDNIYALQILNWRVSFSGLISYIPSLFSPLSRDKWLHWWGPGLRLPSLESRSVRTPRKHEPPSSERKGGEESKDPASNKTRRTWIVPIFYIGKLAIQYERRIYWGIL